MSLRESITEEISHAIECVACGYVEEETAEGHTISGFVQDLERKGWTERDISCLQVSGPCCPNCAKLSEDQILKAHES